MFCGSPGAGKSTFYWTYLEPLGYTRVNQDILKTVSFLLTMHSATPDSLQREKCLKVAGQQLQEGKSVAIGKTDTVSAVCPCHSLLR